MCARTQLLHGRPDPPLAEEAPEEPLLDGEVEHGEPEQHGQDALPGKHEQREADEDEGAPDEVAEELLADRPARRTPEEEVGGQADEQPRHRHEGAHEENDARDREHACQPGRKR